MKHHLNKRVFWPAYLATLVYALALCGPVVQAQGIFVLPGGAEDIEGDSFLNVGGHADHFQVLASARAFPTLPSDGILLTAVSFRSETRPQIFLGGRVSFDNLQVTVASQASGGSPFYQPGADKVLAYSSSIVWDIPRPTTRPASFAIRIPFQTPFFYRPGLQLLIDISLPSPGPSDAFIADWASTSLVKTLGVDSLGHPVTLNGGPVLQLEFQPIPEPSAAILWFAGVLLLWRRACR